jgi:UTP--glucose-1-phosphate uridylyltransferase
MAEKLFQRYLESRNKPPISWDNLKPPNDEEVLSYSRLREPDPSKICDMLNRLVIVKLNGGLGTSMGCTGPKSVIQVRDDLTFLDLTVQQVERLNSTYGCDVPLVLMNSFNTHEDTLKVIKKYSGRNCTIYTFLQSKFPRINKETLQPEPGEFYPPGHGDFYEAFHKSGLLTKFIAEEKREWCFVSNIDNLGASVDLNILNELVRQGKEGPTFVMEVTDKTMADVKGGTLVEHTTTCNDDPTKEVCNKLMLLEIAQVPKDHVDEFKSVKKFRIFNTNNLWIHLKSIKALVESNSLELDIIVNPKHLESGVDVIQLETAAGAAMKYFDRAIGINVPRSRFLPVKKTSDLLLIMSDLYKLDHGRLIMNPKRAFPSVPLVKLGDEHFSKVREFLNRFANIPDVLELNHLTVSGDVTFGKNVSLRGTVIIIANHGDRIDIPAGSVLENKIVSGNLRILDH